MSARDTSRAESSWDPKGDIRAPTSLYHSALMLRKYYWTPIKISMHLHIRSGTLGGGTCASLSCMLYVGVFSCSIDILGA